MSLLHRILRLLRRFNLKIYQPGRVWLVGLLAFVLVLGSGWVSLAQPPFDSLKAPIVANRRIVIPNVSWPPRQPHPLPASLTAATGTAGDYFDQIQAPEAGYLVWSRFPVKVYVQPPEDALKASQQFSLQQLQVWQQAAQQAVQDWQPYLPLQVVNQPSLADISLLPTAPSSRSRGRVKAGETSYTIYLDADQTLRHRMSVIARPNQATTSVLATLRHELGHALGIWGHSPQPSDVLYFAQVAQPPPISARDINTLRRIYQQPTRLGWQVPQAR
jgi:predicted Zn-dependent protease